MQFGSPEAVMRRAIELARRGEGHVEPNPMVGAVVVDDALRLIAEGWHEQFGGPHAEVHALRRAGDLARGATLFCTLEPCAHQGKTPPCTEAVLAAGVAKVVIGSHDPFPQVNGRGIARLRQAGVSVETGLLDHDVRQLNAPFRKLIQHGQPWVHAKWAMTLDGRIASRTGASQWISNALSRGRVHDLRGRMDAILVGVGTALADDPLLTARPPGPRTAMRVVLDSHARLPLDSQLVRTAREGRVLVATTEQAPSARRSSLAAEGVEVLVLPNTTRAGAPGRGGPDGGRVDLQALLQALGARRMTNVLVEGGGGLLGALHDQRLIDEVHVFVAPRLLGGAAALSPVLGWGVDHPSVGLSLPQPVVEVLDGDVYVSGRVRGE
ncbi:MAG: bifunctional diaminohydroxyphosphoribosylaminopyrimidine deaminase/5-amino-6-(5-phosphoribosylamino)uracil reductase RibD [Planctomycetaceae bacterium]